MLNEAPVHHNRYILKIELVTYLRAEWHRGSKWIRWTVGNNCNNSLIWIGIGFMLKIRLHQCADLRINLNALWTGQSEPATLLLPHGFKLLHKSKGQCETLVTCITVTLVEHCLPGKNKSNMSDKADKIYNTLSNLKSEDWKQFGFYKDGKIL